MVDMETIGDRLRKLREDRGLTQEQAAAKADTSKQGVSQIESGRTQNPGGVFLLRWAKFYGVSLEWLITGVGKPDSKSHSVQLDRRTLVDTFNTLDGLLKPTGRFFDMNRHVDHFIAVYQSGGSLSKKEAAQLSPLLEKRHDAKGT